MGLSGAPKRRVDTPMSKNATIKQWAALYEAAQEIRRQKPWGSLCVFQPVWIEMGEEDVYCCVTEEDGYPAVTVYMGDDGFSDYATIMNTMNKDRALFDFAIQDRNALQLVFDERKGVPSDQKARMKELGLRFYGKGSWPVFHSLRSRFAPAGLERDEVVLMTRVLRELYMAVEAYRSGIMVDWAEGMILRRFFSKEENNWLNMGASPDADGRTYPGIVITDELMKKRISKLPKDGENILMDLVYAGEYMMDERYDRPLNALLFVAVDESSGMILVADILDPQTEGADAAMDFFLRYTQQGTCMTRITARNPQILSAMIDVSKAFGVRIRQGNEKNMAALDKAMEEFLNGVPEDEEELMDMLEQMLEDFPEGEMSDDDFDGPF